jgi:hypothetical protein
MKYAIFCYSQEGVVDALTPAQDDAMMRTILRTGDELRAEGKLDGSVRLMNTSTAVTVRHGGAQPLVLDGPFAETKEQLLGFYLIDCDSLETAVDAARRLAKGRPPGSLEIRPVRTFVEPGSPA